MAARSICVPRYMPKTSPRNDQEEVRPEADDGEGHHGSQPATW